MLTKTQDKKHRMLGADGYNEVLLSKNQQGNNMHTSSQIYYSLRFILNLMFGLLLLGNIQLAHGACTTNVSTPILFSTIPSASMPARNAPLITPLSPWVQMYLPIAFNCNTTQPVYLYITGSNSSQVVGYYNDPTDGTTYPVNSYASFPSGVGYILAASLDGKNFVGLTINKMNLVNKFTPTAATVYAYLKLRLIRYGTLSSATITIQGVSSSWGFTAVAANPIYSPSFPNGTTWLTGYVQTAQTLTISNYNNSPTCSVNTANIQVQLPNIQAAQLPGVGASTGTTPFNISINCPSRTGVYMTMTDNSNSGQTSNIISAAPGSTTQGVGVQVKLNGIPISMGPDSSLAGNANQFPVADNVIGNIVIPFTASYIRTSAAAIGVGSLKAVATFTMSYQ